MVKAWKRMPSIPIVNIKYTTTTRSENIITFFSFYSKYKYHINTAKEVDKSNLMGQYVIVQHSQGCSSATLFCRSK